jgi:hypothetical protein
MIIESYTFRWVDYKSPADAELTARWFAAWVRLRDGGRITCHPSIEGPIVTTQSCGEYYDFNRSLWHRAQAGEKLPTIVPPPLGSYAEKGYMPEDVAAPKADEGFIVGPSSIDIDGIALARLPPDRPQEWQPTNPAQLAARLSTKQAINKIRMIANTRFLYTACSLLRQVGMRKPLLCSPERHIYDSVLSNATAMQVMLQYTLLCGAPRGALYPFWDGWGRFLGWQRGAEIANFKSGGKQDSLLIIWLDKAEEIIASLLEPLPSNV